MTEQRDIHYAFYRGFIEYRFDGALTVFCITHPNEELMEAYISGREAGRIEDVKFIILTESVRMRRILEMRRLNRL